MTFLNNLPAGASTDSRAPWNQQERYLCTRCDKEEIEELWSAKEEKIISEMSDDGDLTDDQCGEIQEMEDDFRRQFQPCKNCAQ